MARDGRQRKQGPASLGISVARLMFSPAANALDHGDGFAGNANWFLNGRLAYPSILEGYPGELHIAYFWAGRQAIRYLCLLEEQILGVLQ